MWGIILFSNATVAHVAQEVGHNAGRVLPIFRFLWATVFRFHCICRIGGAITLVGYALALKRGLQVCHSNWLCIFELLPSISAPSYLTPPLRKIRVSYLPFRRRIERAFSVKRPYDNPFLLCTSGHAHKYGHSLFMFPVLDSGNEVLPLPWKGSILVTSDSNTPGFI